ncbi:hypothetical protein [Marinobacter sp. DUT-1]|uniref:hypothetical protein n=1 Tax=Marinobacter sp. DUT-1 TaxID=3412037 RepID=UPI003D18299C
MKRLLLFSVSFFFAWPVPADTASSPELKALTGEACEYLGASCAKHRAECSNSQDPNICLVLVYFDMRVAEERCGKSRRMLCFDENSRYARKWMQELNIPNIGNPKRQDAFKACNSTGNYEVESVSLANLETTLGGLMGVSEYQYKNYKIYYECFQAYLE